MITHALILGLAMAALHRQSPPKDPCTLLKPAEVRALAPGAHVGAGVSSTVSAELGSFACMYKWESGPKATAVNYQLQVRVSDASRLFPGTSAASIKDGLLGTAKPGTANAAVIPGVGDAAVYDSDAPIRSRARALVKGRILEVALEGPDGRAMKPQVIGLLKAAALRL